MSLVLLAKKLGATPVSENVNDARSGVIRYAIRGRVSNRACTRRSSRFSTSEQVDVDPEESARQMV